MTKADLISGFTKLGIYPSQLLMVHSSMKSFGVTPEGKSVVEGGIPTLISALQETVTEEGTIVMPAFTYGQELFEREKTPTRTGHVSDVFRMSPGVLRSSHPTHSICVWGKLARSLTKNHTEISAFGADSPLERFALLGGDILLIGIDYTACSMIHTAERLAQASYVPRFKMVQLVTSDGDVISFKAERAGCSLGFNKVAPYIDASFGILGRSFLALVSAKKILDVTRTLLLEDQAFLLCSMPNCFSCNEARKMIKDNG